MILLGLKIVGVIPMDITKLYQTQISLTEWLAGIEHEKAEALRIEDNDKRERLKVIHQTTGLPYDEPHQFLATDITEKTEVFQKFLDEHGEELCALRLIPLDPALPKLRMRGHTIHDALIWFDEQHIDPAKYKADFVPHSESSRWATIFVVNEQGIFGEIIEGGHHQLTQGIYTEYQPITFAYDWKDWHLIPENPEVERELQETVKHLSIPDASSRNTLKEKIEARFFNNYLLGYFETVRSDEFGLWFIDYNRLLGDLYKDFVVSNLAGEEKEGEGKNVITGQAGSGGKVEGKVRLIPEEKLVGATIEKDKILVCRMTTPSYLPLIQKAGGVVTDLGGILSHAAIVCRELGKPCLVGTKVATEKLQDGMKIELDATNGRLTILD